MTINGIGTITKTASCPAFGDWAIKNKLKVTWANKKIGDIVLFDFNHNGTSDHIGIVYKISGNSIYTIEGNTGAGSNTNGGQVQLRTRTKSQINYFVRPKYNEFYTKEMVLAAALAEVGTKESPKNSNKVKYNRWFYGKDQSAYWCCTFVCWCFAHMRLTPEGRYTGALQTSNIRYGSKNAAVKKWQTFLKWYFGDDVIKADGEFGAVSKRYTMAFQAMERLEIDGCVGKLTRAAAAKYQPKAVAAETTLADKIVAEARRLAWEKGTASSVYRNKPKEAYTAALNKAYPNRSSWGAAAKAGESCDVFIGTLIRTLGIDPNFARGLGNKSQGQWHDFGNTKIFDSIDPKDARSGNFIIYKRNDGGEHVCVIDGEYVIEASHEQFYPVVKGKTSTRLNKSGKKELKVYRAKA